MTRKWRVLVHCAATIAILSFVVPTAARSQAKALGTDELTRKSDVVAHGRVQQLRSQWVGNKERIVTYVTVDVDEYIKGNPSGRTITIVNPGGEVDGVGELYTHMARFKQDEHVVVFVEKDREGKFRMAGGNEGKWSVRRDDATGKLMVAGRKSLDELKEEVKRAR